VGDTGSRFVENLRSFYNVRLGEKESRKGESIGGKAPFKRLSLIFHSSRWRWEHDPHQPVYSPNFTF